MISNESFQPQKAIATMFVSDDVLSRGVMSFDYIKDELLRKWSSEILPSIVNTGQYHVCKLDIVQRERFDLCGVEFGIVAKMSVAQQMEVTMASATLEYDGVSYDRLCFYCGNKLSHDERGGCLACGAPNGGHK